MKTTLSLLVAVFLIQLTASSQVMFQKAYGGSVAEVGWQVIQTSDHGYLVGGWTLNGPAGLSDICLLRLDSIGDTIWTKTLGGTGNDGSTSGAAGGNLIRQTADQGFIICSSSASAGPGYMNQWLIRTDANGNVQWTKVFSSGYSYDYATDVYELADGGFILAGDMGSTGNNGQRATLIRTNVNGDTLWTKKYGGSTFSNLDFFNSVRETSDGGFIAFGYTTSFGSGQNDYYLIKTDGSGNLQWSKTYGGSSSDQGYCVRTTTDGGYILSGESNSYGAGQTDVLVIKTDVTGSIQWSKTYGDLTFNANRDIEPTPDGGYIFTADIFRYNGSTHTYSNASLIKIDASGDTLWTRCYGGSSQDNAYAVKPTTDGGYILAGTTMNLFHPGDDIYLVKTNATGVTNCFEYQPNITVANALPIVSSGCNVTTGATLFNFTTLVNPYPVSDTTLCLLTAIDEPSVMENSFSIYPDPAADHFSLFSNTAFSGEGLITMYDLRGGAVKQMKIYLDRTNETQDIFIGDLAPGVYVVKVETEDGSFVSKLVKR